MASGASAGIAELGVVREEAVCFIPINESQPNFESQHELEPQQGNAWEHSGIHPIKRMDRRQMKFDCLTNRDNLKQETYV
jgi:hypothetical protein